MKKLFLLSILGICSIACSVDRDELNVNEHELRGLDASFETEVCEPESSSFGEVGRIDVTNDSENMYITVVALDGYSLTDLKLHVADEFNDFPTVGQGNLPPGQMEHHRSFSPGEGHDTFTFSLSELDECVLIASKATFQKGDDIVEAWAGPEAGNSGNWYYFEYCEQECEVNNCEGLAGSDNTVNMSLTYANDTFSSLSKAISFFNARVLSDDAVRGGTFDPALVDIEYTGVGTYTTIYTVTVGDCSDSAEFTIIVSDDNI